MAKESPSDVEKLRHTAAHVLAHAIKELYPEALPTIGPTIEDGFYYDFYNLNIKEEDISAIETRMRDIIKRDFKLKRLEKSKKEAKELVKHNKFKQEILEELKEGEITFYQQGDFIDLCRGGHLESTSQVKNFKLLKLAGAYWRGDAKNPMLTRIYGTAFFAEKELKEYLTMLEEAGKRNHMVLGKKLKLFEMHEQSPGAPFFYPKGAVIFNELIRFISEQYRQRGYQEVITPLLYDKSLWETSGHWEHYKEDMFILKIDNREFSLKPMNCPSHCLMYRNLVTSYRDLPLRLADFAPLHRNELKGVLAGLTRVRKFSQDDAHIFLGEDQLDEELLKSMDFVKFVYKDTFQMEIEVRLSTRPEKRMGADELWSRAEQALEKSLKKKKMQFSVDEGAGAFYGPKIDFLVRDCLKRLHQVATIQVDFQLPIRFELQYDGQDGRKHTPIIIHRAILGSLERFIAILTEHFEGKFPLWLSPVQAIVMNISEQSRQYAKDVMKKLIDAGIRAEIDISGETINKKVRNAQLQHINYMITVGDKEQQSRTLAVRTLDGKVKFNVKTDDFIADFIAKIRNRELAC
ncbi:MAG TPA: threonine--tRNA ligase [Candidatus Nanoarchaeia archaeon]|nr:threonine--tRNA ligase [Candidatus Nanoarchaeia archaeon]